jgi:hypothetical protein
MMVGQTLLPAELFVMSWNGEAIYSRDISAEAWARRLFPRHLDS